MGNALRQHFKTKTTKSIRFTYKWTIENYSHLFEESHAWKWEICSEIYSPPNNELFDIEFDLYPKGYSETWKDYVSVRVGVRDMPQIYEGKIRCRWNVSLVDENGKLCWTEDSKIYRLFCTEGRIISDFIKYSTLLSCASQYLPNDQLTLHFDIHLQADDRIFNVITNKELYTSRFDCANRVTKVVYTWTAENFSDLFGEVAVVPFFIQSNHFPALKEKKGQFCLRLYPNGWSEERKDYVDIAIQNDTNNSSTVHWRMSILDVDGEESYTQEGTETIDSNNGTYFGYNRASLLDSTNGLVVDKKLKLYCEISYMINDKQNTTNSVRILDNLLQSESLFDISQKTIQYVSHNWTIDKFSVFCFNSPKYDSIDSQIFEPPTDSRLTFHLRLWPNSHNNKQSKKYLYLDLFNMSQHTNQVTVQYRISLLDANGDKWTRWNDQSTIFKNDNVRDSKFIHQSIFKTPSLIRQYLPNDKLTIICELWVIQDRKMYKLKPTKTQSQVSSNLSGPTTVHISHSNFQGTILSVDSVLNMDSFIVNTN